MVPSFGPVFSAPVPSNTTTFGFNPSEESEMFLSNIPVPILVFLASWLAAPLIYSLDKLAAMEDQRWILIAGVIVLPVFGLMSSVFVRESKAKHEPLFYGRSQLTHI